METTQIVGYRVKNINGSFIDASGRSTWEYPPITQAEAYRRVSVYLTENPNGDVPQVIPVTRTLTPIETASAELGDLLQSLCRRHGLDLGLSKDQVNKQIAKELADLGATGVGVIGMLPRR